ncbi:MAG: periplasmic heavy metal sensor [Blastocatellia bacterium]|nr:periplasmic heavy metal sensor [Blastocatellia bacterium]
MKAKIRRAALLVALFSLATSATTGQGAQSDKLNRQQRSPQRQQERIVAKDTAHNPQDFTGISESGPREFNRRFFSKEERRMIIPGFGRPVIYLVILRQLNLTEPQKERIKAISQRVGMQLKALRQQHALLEYQLEEAIYGEDFDPKRVEELSAQAGQKQADITKMLANIEAEFRQILTPDQHYVFRYLIGEMLFPQRRMQPSPMRRRIDN